MNRRLRVSLSVALACVAGGALWLILVTREPAYQGQPVSFWFKQYVFSISPRREETVEIIAEIGSDAIPYLTKMLRKKESRMGKAYRSYWAKLPDQVKRWLPRPIDPARRHVDAATCLSRLGLSYQIAIPPLIEALKDPTAEKRLIAVRSLRDIGPRSVEIVSALIAAAQDADSIVHNEAVGGLWEFIRTADDRSVFAPAVSVLIGALNHPDDGVRHSAVYALRDLGADARQAVPPLLDKLKNPNSGKDDRIDAACAMGCIDSAYVDVVLPFLETALENYGDQGYIWMVPESLARMAKGSRSLVAPLVALLQSPILLRDPDLGLRFRTMEALGQMGSAANEAVSALTNALKDSVESIRLASALAIWRIDPHHAQTVLPVLMQSLHKGTLDISDVAQMLGQMGAAAPRDAVPFLINALSDRAPFTRQAAAQALWQIDPTQALAIVPVLIEQLARRDVSYVWRLSIIQTLEQMESAAETAVPLLAGHLTHRDRRIQLAAAAALWKIDERQLPQVVSFLIEYLQRKDCWYREIAAELLGKIGPSAKAGVPALRQAANEDDKKLRGRALEALHAIESGAVGQGGSK